VINEISELTAALQRYYVKCGDVSNYNITEPPVNIWHNFFINPIKPRYMEYKFKLGQRVILNGGKDFVLGTVLSFNWEFTIVKFDNVEELTIIKIDKLTNLAVLEEVLEQ
jgi:hypothetical protein